MILAAPLVIPFAEAVGISIASLGMAKAADMVNDYIQENPEQSVKILSTIVPNVGIGQIFANKEDSDDEEVEEDTRSKKEIVLGELGKDKGNYSDEDAEGKYSSKRGRIIRALEDAGKVNPDREYNPEKKYQGYKRFLKKADGGRIGFNNGGNLGLNEQAQNIYDSWISAGHSEADTLAYLESRGMYNTPVKQQGIMTAPNIINKKLRDDGGDDTGNIITPYDPNINLGPNKDVFDYEADAYGIGPTFRGQFARLQNAYSKIPTPFNIVKMGIQKAQDFADQRRKEKEREAAAATEALQAQITAQANITARDLVARGASPDFGKTETRSSSGWENSPFAKGGVATMFKRKR